MYADVPRVSSHAFVSEPFVRETRFRLNTRKKKKEDNLRRGPTTAAATSDNGRESSHPTR